MLGDAQIPLVPSEVGIVREVEPLVYMSPLHVAYRSKRQDKLWKIK